jgi:hypothetical protein
MIRAESHILKLDFLWSKFDMSFLDSILHYLLHARSYTFMKIKGKGTIHPLNAGKSTVRRLRSSVLKSC